MTSAASVKERLKNRAVANGKTMQEALTAYGLERTVYRLSVSDYVERFTLKGGIFLYALFDGEFARATRDIDLLAGNIPNDEDNMRKVFDEIFSIECDDAIRYDMATLEVKNIAEFKRYHGVNISIAAYLDKTRVQVSIDIGFGDVVIPDRVKMDFPVLLDMDVPRIYAYSIPSVIAEKFEAMVSLGDANSRYKDFYDIYLLANRYEIAGQELQAAIMETFEHRKTSFDDIFVFKEDFLESPLHQSRWKSFLKKKKAMIDMELVVVIALMKELLLPVVDSIKYSHDFTSTWDNKDHNWK
ncbi:MAG: nucleotidyl transferase AbiEii/AbiGii toxin family protein [Selenomonadaceae bacterium]|nr:nucleotidyl transferase AbiEii/AbiGii toxin family protein [Selenomonadaceae bacterium]